MDQLPTSFGKQSKRLNVAAQIDETKRGALDENQSSTGPSSSNGSDSSDEEEEDDFPTSHSLLLKTQTRAVISITLDPAGSRLATACTDTIKLHDFASMTPTTVRAFRSIEASALKHIEFGPASSFLQIGTTAKILSRDGEVQTEFVKGDMYLRDMNKTKGHVSEITTGTWHPTDKTRCVTAGTDSTLRIWDVNYKRSQKEVIVHKSKVPGGRSRLTAVAWNHFLVAAALDGGLVMWGSDGPYHRPSAEIEEAHVKDSWTSSVDISNDGRLVVSRGGDDTIKLWDTRKFKTPIATTSHPSTADQYGTSNIRFSPDSSNILTGSSSGHLHIFGLSLRPELSTPVTPNSPLITVQWHDKLNQIFTGSANGETNVLYNPSISNKGATLVLAKAPKRRHIDDDPSLTTDISQGMSGEGNDATNSSVSFAARHPNVGLTASGRSRDPRRPNLPAQTPFSKSQPDEKHIREHVPLSSMRDEDPREALLKYADAAAKNPQFTYAWKDTQPKTIYAELSDEEEEEGRDKKRAKR
ncbi:MAG: hypothetical protein M1814_000667 [Vezdaea aestivalis]|nr:MAG: hypothetical protein M1814_000667 [Vezdaea aestivalis]